MRSSRRIQANTLRVKSWLRTNALELEEQIFEKEGMIRKMLYTEGGVWDIEVNVEVNHGSVLKCDS